MWIVAQYLPVSFFSLRPAGATSSGGKTLLVPTPYAIKMALLNAAICSQGINEGEHLFPFIRDLSLYLDPPEELIVVKSFSKIRRELKDKSNPEKAQRAREKKEYPMQPTIAYREYINYHGTLRLACEYADDFLSFVLPPLFTQINYLGKRGGFIQIMEPPEQVEQLPPGRFIELTPDDLRTFNSKGTLQMLDDCGKSLTFQRANIYSAERITLGKERILRHVVLPYRLKRSSRGYSWYEYIGEEA